MKNTLKFILFLGFITGISNFSYAQNDYSGLNVLIKAGSHSRYYAYTDDNYNSNAHLNAYFKIPIAENITIAPVVGLPFNFDWVLVGVRADYFFDSHIDNLPEELNLYGGVGSGFVIGLDDFIDNGFEINFNAGGEWRFNETWGAIVEFGVGTTSFGGVGVGIHF